MPEGQACQRAGAKRAAGRSAILWAVAVVFLLGIPLLSSCGGGSSGGSGTGPPPPSPDFQLSVPASASVTQGASTHVAVGLTAVNGFDGSVSVTISGVPIGVMATPSSFSLSPGGSQPVTLSAGSNAAATTTSLSVSGTSGALQHSSHLALTVTASQGGGGGGAGPEGARVRLVQTDTQWDTGFLSFFPQTLILYDPGTKRFFLSDPSLNEVDVIDAASEQVIAKIPVPGAFLGDETPDHTKIYVGTQVGDVYQIDPVGMKVVQRFPAVQIGPAGFAAFQAKMMSDGSLALLGGQGGIPSVDGYSAIGIWNPATNAFVQYGASFTVGGPNPAGPICDGMGHIAEFALTADRTHILVSSADSDGTLCLMNPQTGTFVVTQANDNGPIMVPADGKEILTASDNQITVYDSTTLFQIQQFVVGGSQGLVSFHFVLSPDGNTLYAVGHDGATALAINWRTRQQLGWFVNYSTFDEPFASDPVPLAADETGLIANAIDHGVALLDGSALLAQQPRTGFPFGFANVVDPTFGPAAGGTQATIDVQITNVADVSFAEKAGQVVSEGNAGLVVTVPAGQPGPADARMNAADNSFLFLPNGYSYGPSIVEVTPNQATADGGQTGTIYGYGFGSAAFSGTAPGLQVSVGGQAATITQYVSEPYSQVPWYPFPLEAIEYTIPAGTRGSGADVAVSNVSGVGTVSNGIRYLPAVQQFPLTGAVLIQGIYDPKRDVYYFTDQTQVRVFSRTKGQWLPPIPMPAGAMRLWGISLSPSGSMLAVADASANQIYVFDPDTPAAISTFPLPNAGADEDQEPCGLAIADSGIVYYASFSLEITGGPALHKLNTATGVVTDYQNVQDGNLGGDAFIRVVLSKDNSRVYFNIDGAVFSLDTASDTITFNPVIVAGDYELTLSSNQTWMSATEYLMDTNLNPQSYVVYVDRDVWNLTAVFGEKVSPDGNLLFSPLTNAIDVIDGHAGVLLARVALPVTLSPNYDALVDDGQDNVLIAITGNSSSGIAVIDLNSIAEPLNSMVARATTSKPGALSVAGWTAASMANSRSLLAKPKMLASTAPVVRPHKTQVSPALPSRR